MTAMRRRAIRPLGEIDLSVCEVKKHGIASGPRHCPLQHVLHWLLIPKQAPAKGRAHRAQIESSLVPLNLQRERIKGTHSVNSIDLLAVPRDLRAI